MAPRRLLPLLLAVAAAAALGPEPGVLRVPEHCLLPKVVGRCRASMPRWWFNATSGLCQSFVFGGCNANLNNFLTEQQCQASCARSGVANKPGHPAEEANDSFSYEEFCMVPQVTGPCRASFSRWYYSPANRTCKQFIYGGCQGNKNNYQKEEQCMRRCSPEPGKTGSTGPDFHSHLLSTKNVALAVLLAVLAAVLLGYMIDVSVKMCRKSPELTAGTAWSRLDDKEYLMSNAYTL
ncbi:putative Kunitz-type serine protease inhibitor [Dromaius novaehollandiae]|uniref:Putative Kunitz-type serine protease inhibitor n=1 Tax=Dromaius novaehollandiae TaxID=8790 RepID=A0A8C4P880_DRONO|nr:putative Kunitz-type serine protease inhibitor [Dromaius novaehollandiae]